MTVGTDNAVLARDEVQVLTALARVGGRDSVLGLPGGLLAVARRMVGAVVPLVAIQKCGTEVVLTAAGRQVVAMEKRGV